MQVMKRNVGVWLVCLMAALALGACASVQTAYAADVATYAPAETYLTKNYDSAANLEHPGETFTFNITKVSVNGLIDTASLGEMPALGNQAQGGGKVTLDFTAASGKAVGTAKGDTWIPAVGDTVPGNTWLHAGEYVYTITEAAGSTQKTTYSKAEYKVRIYVVNVEGASPGLAISGITVEKMKNDADTPDFTPIKVDPKDGETTGTAFAFNNVYRENHNLTVSKTVDTNTTTPDTAGANAGDLTKQFDYTMTLTLPELERASWVGKTVTFVKNDAGTTQYATAAFAADGTATVTFTLCHGESITCLNESNYLPTGTTYVVTETGVKNYTPSAVVKTSGATDATVNGTVDQNLTVGDAGHADANTIVGNDNDSSSAFTNTYKNTPPTGILIDNLPFILLIGAAAAGLVVFVVSRRKRTIHVA